MIAQQIRQFINTLTSDKLNTNKVYNDLGSYYIISDELPDYIKKEAHITEQFVIKGSIGKGLISEIPMICILDSEITKSPQEGYYIVFLFVANLSGFYLSLNQGWAQYDKNYGGQYGQVKIRENVNYIRKVLKSTSSFSFENVCLLAKKSNKHATGYELGNICSKYYSLERLPDDDVFIDDLRNLIGVYRELKGIVGTDILNIKLKLDEDIFQEKIQTAQRINLPIGPIPRKEEKTIEKNTSIWGRNPDIAFLALEKASFKCEHDFTHETFISAKTSHQFIEAHHLIPLKFQKDFNNSLDVPENIIGLCPNCHKAFHFSESSYKKFLIKRFFETRQIPLRERGLEIDINTLLKYYDILNG